MRQPPDDYRAYLRKIAGWLSAGDAKVITLLSELQHDLGCIGNMLEIGVYHGKSAVLLGSLLSSQENLEVCDVFGFENLSRENVLENRRFYGGLTRSQFEQNYLRHFSDLPMIHDCPSSELISRLAGRKFRFIHIDGSHSYDNVISDISTAIKSLTGAGIIALDDWCHSDHPGVAAAIWETIIDLKLEPVLVTDMKMYATIRVDGSAEDGIATGVYNLFRSHRKFNFFEHNVRGTKFLQVRLKGKTRRNSICF